MSSPFRFHPNCRATVNESLRRLTWASYLVALLFFVFPVVDILTNVWPWEFSGEQWRFGLAGITSNYLISLIFGLLWGACVAAALGHRAVLSAIGVLAGVGTLMLLLLTLTFTLDTLQVRNQVLDDQRALFVIGAFKTMGKIVAAMVTMLVLALNAFRAAKAASASRAAAR